METISFDVELSVQETTEALQDIHAAFVRRQEKQTSLSTPLVLCSELTARKSLSKIPDSPEWLKPDTEDTFERFEFFADWKHTRPGLVRVWTLQVETKPGGARLVLQPMDNLPADYRDLYRMFALLVEVWATELQQKQNGETAQEGAQTQGEANAVKSPAWPAGQPMYEENKWLIEQHFEHNRPLRDLREEWLERRQAEGRQDLANPNDSMRRVISDEKKRRKESEGE